MTADLLTQLREENRMLLMSNVSGLSFTEAVLLEGRIADNDRLISALTELGVPVFVVEHDP